MMTPDKAHLSRLVGIVLRPRPVELQQRANSLSRFIRTAQGFSILAWRAGGAGSTGSIIPAHVYLIPHKIRAPSGWAFYKAIRSG